MNRLKKVVLQILLISIIFSCYKEPLPIDNGIIDIQIAEPVAEEEIQTEESIIVLPEKKEYTLNIINDDVIFSELKSTRTTTNKFAIVGSDHALLFPYVELKSNSDLELLVNGEAVESGTIISIEDILQIEGTIHENFFRYEIDNNYFYKTIIDDKEWLIWGADLIVDIKDPDVADRISYYYRKDTKSKDFLPFNGGQNLTNENILDIKENRIAFQTVEYPNDFLSLYKGDAEHRDNTLFITTDLMLYTIQTLSNNLRTSVEQDIHPMLLKMVDKFLEDLEVYESEDSRKNFKYSEALFSVKNYFLLSKLLLSYSEDGQKINELLLTMPDDVISEYSLISSETGFSDSPILGSTIDYSQYTPIGHYSENDTLKSYFMTMVWFGRIDMDQRMAIIISTIAKENIDLYKLWSEIFDPIIYLTGESDDLSFYDMFPLLEKADIYNLSYWLEEDENLFEFTKDSIIPNFNINPKTFRLFGQGFRFMNVMHKHLSYPQIESRLYGTGLDLMASLGSRSAISLIEQSESDNDYWNEYLPVLNDFISFFNKKDEGFWGKTFYSRYLNLIRSTTMFEQNRDFYFMEKGKWNQKVLNTSSGAWAEFINDSISYEIQDYQFTGKENNLLTTFRTIPYPRPIHYVEPNIVFFNSLSRLLLEIMDNIDFNKTGMEYKDKFVKLEKITLRLSDIVKKEISNSPITDKQNEFLVTLPIKLSMLIHPEKVKNPGISDMFAKVDEGEVLETGTGTPYRIFVALKDEQGGKRIATGYTYSYYEFKQSVDDSFTNSEWLDNFKSSGKTLNQQQPFWAKEYIK